MPAAVAASPSVPLSSAPPSPPGSSLGLLVGLGLGAALLVGLLGAAVLVFLLR
jgi:hypothetical protein